MVKNIKNIGDVVYVDGYTTMAQQNAGNEEIEDVKYKFDEDSGERYPIYKVGDEWYDGRTGACHSNKNSMYYIDVD